MVIGAHYDTVSHCAGANDTAPFRYAHYHQGTDTLDKIDFDRFAKIMAGVGRVIEEIANE